MRCPTGGVTPLLDRARLKSICPICPELSLGSATAVTDPDDLQRQNHMPNIPKMPRMSSARCASVVRESRMTQQGRWGNLLGILVGSKAEPYVHRREDKRKAARWERRRNGVAEGLLPRYLPWEKNFLIFCDGSPRLDAQSLMALILSVSKVVT